MHMKTLFALALSATLALPAHADRSATRNELCINNTDGGQICLTRMPAEECDGAFVAYTYASTGESTFGCWGPFNGKALVAWPGGNIRIYDLRAHGY